MFSKLEDYDFKEKRILLRADLNVPIQNNEITNDSRIRKSIPTIKAILDKKPHQLIIISHLGRPKGEYSPELSLKPVAEHLQKLLGQKIHFETNPRINNLTGVPDEKIVMLENLRFDNVEIDNDDFFAHKLAGFADVFVLDAFGAVHRNHASIVGVPKYIPSCAGLLLEREISYLRDTLSKPEKPYVAIIGGAKTDKEKVIDVLLEKVDMLIVGGVLANTFLKAKGFNIGKSKFSNEFIEHAKQLIEKYPNKIAVPVDFIIGNKFSEDAEARVAGIKDNIDSWMILDIGPYTISGYIKILNKAKTVFWAGPIGVFEYEKFRRGTWDIARNLAELDITKIIGGGESAAAIEFFKLQDKMTHVSTGGGAALELISGNVLPGIKALEENYEKFKKPQ